MKTKILLQAAMISAFLIATANASAEQPQGLEIKISDKLSQKINTAVSEDIALRMTARVVVKDVPLDQMDAEAKKVKSTQVASSSDSGH